MNEQMLRQYMDIAPEVAEAIREGKPVVSATGAHTEF